MHKTYQLRNKFYRYIFIVYFIFMTLFLFFEYRQIEANFTNEHQLKNVYITKMTDALLESLKKDTYTKISFLSEDQVVMKALATQNRPLLFSLVEEYYKRQKALNPYLKIMTFRNSNGSTFLRIHKPELYGDPIEKGRDIINDTNKNLTVNYGFEVGKLEMSYRVVVPLFYQGKHIGLIEVGIDPEYLLDSFTKTFDTQKALLVKQKDLVNSSKKLEQIPFIDNFAMVRGDQFFQNNYKFIPLDKNNITLTDNHSSYLVDTTLNLYNHKSEVVAKLLFASKIENMGEFYRLLTWVVLFSVAFFGLFFFVTHHMIGKFIKILTEKVFAIEKEAKKTEAIFDGSSNIIVLSDGRNIIDANRAFLKFFSEYESLDDFKKEFNCICDRFTPYPHQDYIWEKEIDGLTWSKYIATQREKIHKVAIKKENQLYHFIAKVNEVMIDNSLLQVIDLSDITTEYIQQQEIKQQAILIASQSKMVALGEMIGNIAHQWRQPLSTISTIASGILFQEEIGIAIEKEKLQQNLAQVMRTTEYLSQTIDDFRDFIKGDKEKTEFYLQDAINKSLSILEASLKNHYIKVTTHMSTEDILIEGYFNELIQGLNNILNNAKDILVEKNIEEKIIDIKIQNEKNHGIISICDNGLGIPQEIIEKIFEPYFTTKHQSQGTGLGLYMTHKIITESFLGEISIENKNFEIDGISYYGACFVIKLPLASQRG